jgi:hypothetical protein
MGKFSVGDMITIALVAFVGVWLIDKGLNVAGLKAYAINNS